jgi:integrase
MAVLMGIIGMLRVSNVALVSIKQFQLSKHLTRGDLQISQDGISVQLRWSNTIQNYRQGAEVVLPYIKTSNICSVATLLALNKQFPILPNQPLLPYKLNHSLKILTRAKLLNMASTKLKLQHNITFHALRHSAASLAFQSGVPIEQIKAQGCWSSEAIWSYIDSAAKTVQSFLHN